MIPVLRRYLPAFAIVLALVLVLSDWPLNWSFWLDYPFVTALAAGVVLLLLTGSVVDVILRRREARRWVDIGRGAAYALDQVFYFSGIAMFQLLGVGGQMSLSPEIEFHVAPARARAVQLLPNRPDLGGVDVMIEVNEERASALRTERLPVLLRDGQWRDHALLAILALAHAQELTIARWISAFGALGDHEGFRRVGRSIEILDRAEVVVQHLLVIRDVEVRGGQFDSAASDTAVRTVMSYWEQLVRTYYEEAYYWEDRHASGSGLGISEHPTTRLRKQRRPRGTGAHRARTEAEPQ